MSSETLTFADGTVYENSYAFESGMRLFIYVKNNEVTLRDLFDMLTDPIKTATITCVRFDEETTFTGFTDFCSISKESDKLMTGVLKLDGGQNA